MFPCDKVRSVTLEWGRLPPSATRAERRGGVEGPGRAVVGGHVHARVGGDVQDRMISGRQVGRIIRDGVVPVGRDRVEDRGQVVRLGVRVGRRVVALAEDGVGQGLEVAGDVDPGRSGVGGRGDRVGHVVDAVLGDGVGVVAAPGGIGDDLLDGRSIQSGGDIGPAAAGVLADVDRAGARADVEEVAEVADALRGAGVGGAEGQGEAGVGGAAEGRRRADVEPGHALVRAFEDVAGARADEQVGAIDRVDDEVGDAVGRPLRVGRSGYAVAGLQEAEGPAGAVRPGRN